MTSLLLSSSRPCAWVAERNAIPFWDSPSDGCRYVREEPFARDEQELIAQVPELESAPDGFQPRSLRAAPASRESEPDEKHAHHRPIAAH